MPLVAPANAEHHQTHWHGHTSQRMRRVSLSVHECFGLAHIDKVIATDIIILESSVATIFSIRAEENTDNAFSRWPPRRMRFGVIRKAGRCTALEALQLIKA